MVANSLAAFPACPNVPTIVAPTKVVPMANASTPGQSPIKPVPPATSAASETAAADPAEPGDPSGMTISMRELVDLLVGVGETKLGGTAITRHAVRARMRKPDDAPAEYADLVKLKDAKTGRFPKAEALAVVARVAARVQQK